MYSFTVAVRLPAATTAAGARSVLHSRGEDAADEAVAAVSERPKHERLALLQREPCRVAHDDAVRDERDDATGGRPSAEQATERSQLAPPGSIVFGGDRVQ